MSGAEHNAPSHPRDNSASMDPSHVGKGAINDADGSRAGGADTTRATASVDHRALIERISELEDGAEVRDKTIRKEVKAEMQQLDEKIAEMPPDKALKHLRQAHQSTLIALRTAKAEGSSKQTELDKVHSPAPFHPYQR